MAIIEAPVKGLSIKCDGLKCRTPHLTRIYLYIFANVCHLGGLYLAGFDGSTAGQASHTLEQEATFAIIDSIAANHAHQHNIIG